MSEELTPGRGYRRIYRRVLTTLLLLAVTPLVALGWFSVNRINTIYDEKISSGLEALTSSKHRALDTFLSERTAQIRSLAFTHSYEELSDTARLSQIFSVLQSGGRSFVDMGIIDLSGHHVSYVGPYDLRNADYHEAAWFGEVLRRGVYVSNVFLGVRKVPHFIIAVLRHDNGHSYIMRATIDMEAITDLLQRIYSGRHADAFLISEEGILQTDSLYYGKAMTRAALDLSGVRRGRILLRPLSPGNGEVAKPAPEARNNLSAQADASKQGMEESPGESIPQREGQSSEAVDAGASLAAAFSHLDTMPWILVVADSLKEYLVPLRTLKLLILCFVLVGTVLVAVGAFASTRSLVSFLVAKDRQQANIDARLLQSSKMAALGKMAAGVAHEVNNPLMLIQENAGWISDLLSDESPSNMKNYAEILSSCEKISANVQRARGITQRMLGFGRRMNPGRAEVMMNVVADHVVELLQTEAKSHNVTIVRDYAGNVPVILSDPAQLEQVVLNIIDNAIDAIGRDGTVTLTTAGTPAGGASIAIKDTGPGLPPETLARIFDPFFTTKAVGEGTGLGLSICYNILEKIGGRIDVKSTPGKGTTFTVTLPPEPPQVKQDDGFMAEASLTGRE